VCSSDLFLKVRFFLQKGELFRKIILFDETTLNKVFNPSVGQFRTAQPPEFSQPLGLDVSVAIVKRFQFFQNFDLFPQCFLCKSQFGSVHGHSSGEIPRSRRPLPISGSEF
jgi:hypothetical protein